MRPCSKLCYLHITIDSNCHVFFLDCCYIMWVDVVLIFRYFPRELSFSVGCHAQATTRTASCSNGTDTGVCGYPHWNDRRSRTERTLVSQAPSTLAFICTYRHLS